MRNSLKAVLFLLAFSPALISVGAARLWSGGEFWDAIYYIIAGLMGTLSIIYVLSALKWHGEKFPFQAKKIESNDALLLGVIVTYILPFFVRAADVTVIVVIAIFVVAWAIFWFTDSAIPSPLLRVLGYRFYKAEASNGMIYTLISNREIRDPSNVKLVNKISGSMLLEIIE
ncbi:hypothetical protein [Taklimakanibacter albus]|uniref:Uncharacterized protein n=1 Tax=Taklimakanibacter albus TaxID=2800327 RepID=A0ACC5RC45_9HYPH|nr:hypothetical protein [Aestuariivirga sp. YIM B02566]MBK1869963.1 hypothetical protein [Aestuariivirga sp. YIM B02566]